MRRILFIIIMASLIACETQTNNDSLIINELAEIKDLAKKIDTVLITDTLVVTDTVYSIDTVLLSESTPIVELLNQQILYRGLANPVSISGINLDNSISIDIQNGSVKERNSKGFSILPGKGKTVNFLLKNLNGDTLLIREYRVKNSPDPKAYFAGVTGTGNIPKKKLIAAQGVLAKMENFEYDLKFEVISFVMMATVKGKVVEQRGRGARINNNMKVLIRTLRPGQALHITRIKARGPDGSVRDLGNILLKVI